jgi:hypothetical protein
MSEGIYYLRVNGKVEGPFTIGQIYDLWAARKINSQTNFARFEEMDKWQPLSELTLKISAPKMPNARPAQPEAPPSQPPPSRSRAANPYQAAADEYIPPAVYAQDQPRHKRELNGIFSKLLRQKKLSLFSFASGFCILLGAFVTVYFVTIPFPAIGIKDPEGAVAAVKQGGVIAGIGLMLFGGLVLIARQVTLLAEAVKLGGAKRGD